MFTWLDRMQPFGALVMRLTLGSVLVVHGYAKIIPHGALYQFAHYVASLHLPYWLGYVAAFTEFFGGLALILGLLARFAALGAAIEMAVAVLRVHLHHGLTGPGGMEFPLACFALALMLVFTGAGYLSLDAVLFRGKA
jgi:putative oxidoreductase